MSRRDGQNRMLWLIKCSINILKSEWCESSVLSPDNGQTVLLCRNDGNKAYEARVCRRQFYHARSENRDPHPATRVSTKRLEETLDAVASPSPPGSHHRKHSTLNVHRYAQGLTVLCGAPQRS